jgi:hypothetical protein
LSNERQSVDIRKRCLPVYTCGGDILNNIDANGVFTFTPTDNVILSSSATMEEELHVATVNI